MIMVFLISDNIVAFCSQHPNTRVPNKVNCAQYYDCSNQNSIYQPYLHECPYPKLFSVATLQCENFEQVTCGARTEPKAPCKFSLLVIRNDLLHFT